MTLFPCLQQQAGIKGELSGRHISVVFDGTMQLGEAMAVVIHYIDTYIFQYATTSHPSQATS